MITFATENGTRFLGTEKAQAKAHVPKAQGKKRVSKTQAKTHISGEVSLARTPVLRLSLPEQAPQHAADQSPNPEGGPPSAHTTSWSARLLCFLWASAIRLESLSGSPSCNCHLGALGVQDRQADGAERWTKTKGRHRSRDTLTP